MLGKRSGMLISLMAKTIAWERHNSYVFMLQRNGIMHPLYFTVRAADIK